MPALLKMALRNVAEHRSKSLIIGTLLALGAFIIVLGNSFIDASKAGIRTMFTESYTGDIFVSGISEEGDVSLFGVMSVGGLAETPRIPEYERVREIVRGAPGVKSLTGMATGFGAAMREVGDNPEERPEGDSAEEMRNSMASRMLFLFGIDGSSYWDVFDTIEMTSGTRLEPGMQGVIINETQLAKMAKTLKRGIGVGDKILVQGMSGGGMRLRELTVAGTYKPRGQGSAPEQMAFADIDTIRVFSGMTVGSAEAVTLSAEQTGMLAADDTDSLFSDDLFTDTPTPAGAAFDEKKLAAQLSDVSGRERANAADLGAWQFIVARTGDPGATQRAIRAINERFKAEGIKAVAGDWQKASGPYGQSVDVVRVVFTVAIVILAIVAVIIIMNTFVISVIERTGEIGTMRAIGAGRKFVRRMFVAEAGILSLAFSTLGALLGWAAAAILGAMRIAAGNDFFEILFGGKFLSPVVTPVSFIAAIFGMVLVGYLANLYPVSVALKIQPVRAMQTE